MSKTAVPVGVLLALALHLILGWELGVVGAIYAGWAGKGNGFRTGALVLGIVWAALIAYNFAVAPSESMNMAEVMAGLLGSLPAFVTVLLTLLISVVVGGVGGMIGSSFRPKTND